MEDTRPLYTDDPVKKLAIKKVLWEQQGGVCKICGSKDNLVIDHNHTSIRVRGLVCSGCNTTLGQFENGRIDLENWKKNLCFQMEQIKRRIEVAPKFVQYLERDRQYVGPVIEEKEIKKCKEEIEAQLSYVPPSFDFEIGNLGRIAVVLLRDGRMFIPNLKSYELSFYQLDNRFSKGEEFEPVAPNGVYWIEGSNHRSGFFYPGYPAETYRREIPSLDFCFLFKFLYGKISALGTEDSLSVSWMRRDSGMVIYSENGVSKEDDLVPGTDGWEEYDLRKTLGLNDEGLYVWKKMKTFKESLGGYKVVAKSQGVRRGLGHAGLAELEYAP